MPTLLRPPKVRRTARHRCLLLAALLASGGLLLTACGGGNSDQASPQKAPATDAIDYASVCQNAQYADAYPDRCAPYGDAGGGGAVDSDAAASNDPGEAPSVAYLASVNAFNASQFSSVGRGLAQTGSVDCAVQSSADFPDNTLITIIASSGPWFQFSFAGSELQPAATRSGDDYSTALGGTTWSEFKANGTVVCSIDPATGQISVQ